MCLLGIMPFSENWSQCHFLVRLLVAGNHPEVSIGGVLIKSRRCITRTYIVDLQG